MLSLFILSGSACGGGNRLKTVTSADAVGYAVRYPDALSSASDSFAAHQRQAQQLSSGLPAHTPEVKAGDDRVVLQRVVDYADVDGRRESVVRAQQNERAVRSYWESERGAIGARVTSAAQKQLADAGCTNNVDPQPAVQQALREGFERQLDRRMRAESEAQRVLEQYRPQLTAATYTSMQKLVDEIMLASYLVYVALPEDAAELQRLQREQSTVVATLERAQNDEQALQASGAKGAELKASQERVQRIEGSRATLAASSAKADALVRSHEQQLKQTQDDYERARLAARDRFAPPPPAATAAAPAK